MSAEGVFLLLIPMQERNPLIATGGTVMTATVFTMTELSDVILLF